ncbi:MAG: MarR family transcriptional regulator [Thermomicrobiales bacterium]
MKVLPLVDDTPAIVPSGLADHTGYWLNRLRGLVHSRFEALLAEHGVTVAQWSVLITVYRGDADTPLEIARWIDLDPGALTRLLDRMEDKGLILRQPVDGDRRRIRIALSPRANALAPQLAALADANDAAFFGALPREEQAVFRHLLGELLRAQGVAPPPEWERG